MRICLISNGKSEHIQRLANYLASKNHEVHLISGNAREPCSTHITLHHLNNMPALWPYQVRQFIEHIKPDIVDGHYASVYGFLAALSGFHPLVVTLWGSDILVQPWQNPIWKLTTKHALLKADIINCFFPVKVADTALTKLKVDISKARTRILGVDTEVFKPLGFDSGLAREIGIVSGSPLIINTRGFEPVYDFATFFKAIPLVLAKIPEAKFMALYKKGKRNVGEKLAQQLGIANNVILMEWLPRSKMPQLLSLASIYVSTSISDGASNALLEAMSCAVTPVVTDIPANRHWVKDGENGLLFPLGKSQKLAESIVYLINNDDIRSKFSVNCRKIVQERAEQNQQMQKIEMTYCELIDNYR